MRKQPYASVVTPVEELATLVYHHFGKAPMGWTGIDKLTEYAHNEQFVQRVLSLYAYAKSDAPLLRGINPSQYYKIIYKFQLASKSLSLDKQVLTDCYFTLANYCIRVYNRNLEEIEQALPDKNFVPAAAQAEKMRITMLSALLRSFSETLYCDEHTIAGEIYSPIEQGDYTYIVRKYTLLAAKELRPELADCPAGDVAIYVRYKGLVQRPVTDIVGNLLITENILPHIDGYCVEAAGADGQWRTLDDKGIDDLIAYFSRIVPLLVANYKQTSLEDRLWMKILCEYYALKPYCDAVGMAWQPQRYPLDIAQIADPSRPIVRANNALATLTDGEEILCKLINLNDPRIHW